MCLERIWSRRKYSPMGSLVPTPPRLERCLSFPCIVANNLHQVVCSNHCTAVGWFPSWAVAGLFQLPALLGEYPVLWHLSCRCILFVLFFERYVPVILKMKTVYLCASLRGNALSSKDSLGQIARAFHLTIALCIFFRMYNKFLESCFWDQRFLVRLQPEHMLKNTFLLILGFPYISM